ncbi:hypothetical protein HPB49_002954 [Dermacentor silvarum]|uniref:Uncharacterized protein n=1 Tax=Dermacentor silvarum TaxID=543639 RepID=A0ACB8DSN1_DERSI|nr:hypothetical protein HPB49_002954 [Dermacentor silvarum]
MLYEELLKTDLDEYRRLLRVSREQLLQLMTPVEPRIRREDTIMRRSISAETLLQVTLRYLASEEITRLKKIKILLQRKRRLTKKNETAQEIIRHIKDQKLTSEESMEVLTAAFSLDIQQLLNRAGIDHKGTYPSELRAFALTLHLYAPSAYEYICMLEV